MPDPEEAQSDEKDPEGQLGPAEQRPPAENGIDHPVQVEPVRDEHGGRYPEETLRFALRFPRDQDEERNEEMKNGQHEYQASPESLEALLVPEHLLRHVRVPHQQVLREAYVGPKNDEGEEESAQVV